MHNVGVYGSNAYGDVVFSAYTGYPLVIINVYIFADNVAVHSLTDARKIKSYRGSGLDILAPLGSFITVASVADPDKISWHYGVFCSVFLIVSMLTLAFICRLCRRVSGSIGESGGGGEIIGVMEYIKNNLDQKLTLEELCRIASMSRATLNRRFNEALGQSPMNYVLFSRVSRAKELIEESNLSKTEIAHLCGFYDVAHMNKYI